MAESPSIDTDRPKLALAKVCSGYGAADVINDATLSLPSGKILALMGKNGMGKTTLLKTILGLIPLRGGDIALDGNSIAGISPTALVASGVAYSPQEQAIFQDLSIRDNLRLALPSDGLLNTALERLYAHFPIFKDRLSQKAGTLSGGEQKMLNVGRALMLEPKLLLLDEISEGLQPSMVDRIAGVLRQERQRNLMTVLLVEQNLDFALSLADNWAVIERGQIDDAGSVDSNSRELLLGRLKI